MNNDKVSYFTGLLIKWQEKLLDNLPNIFFSLIIMILFIYLARVMKKLTMRFNTKTLKLHYEASHILASLTYLIFIFSGLFISMNILGFNDTLTKILAGAGVLGIVAGFAFKDIASNIFAGLLLKAQLPFAKNDWVEISNNFGVVEQIGWITTTIKTVPGQQVYIPNQIIYRDTFSNFSTYHKRRVILESRVSFNDDLDKVKQVSLEEASKTTGALIKEDIEFFFTEIGPYAYTFQLRFWIKFYKNTDYRKAMSEIIMRIKKRFEQEGICISYPITTVDLSKQKDIDTINISQSIPQKD